MSPWLFLFASIALEITATTLLRMSEGFAHMQYAVISVCLYIVCFFCFSQSLKVIPLSVAISIWSGVGVLCISLISARLFAEGFPPLKIALIGMVVTGCVGLMAITKTQDSGAGIQDSEQKQGPVS
jgi:small multidrug resistance pump